MFEKEIETHNILFSGSSLQIGKMHWYILRADTVMREKCYVQPKEQKQGMFDLMEEKLTPFGEEVLPDEIHWWIFRREKAHEDLLSRTKKAFSSAQKLKVASTFLKKVVPTSYSDLVERIKKFTEENSHEIQDLLGYVLWLSSKDELAPTILFTYRVWGSTRASDRMITISKDRIEEDEESVRVCAEIALGLRDQLGYTITEEYTDIAGKIYESLEFEEVQPTQIYVPEDELLARASYKTLSELAIYFEFLRNSMREVLIDIGKYYEPDRLLHQESFWKEFIAKAMSSNRVETQFWDFKETLEMWQCKADKKEEYETSFSERVAGFMNSMGGAIVIGVTDKHPREIAGVDGLEDKIKSTKSVLERHIAQASNHAHFQQVRLKNKAGPERDCLVLALAQTTTPVQVKNHKGWYSYPLRQGTGLTRCSYDEIKEMKKAVSRDNYNFLSNLYVFTNDLEET